MARPEPSSRREDDIPRSGSDLLIGSFRFWFVGQRWEWSEEVARMHGYEPGTVTPSTELLLAHKHPDDRRHVQELLDQALHSGRSFSSRHRFIDSRGAEHTVLVLADRMLSDGGAVVGTEGYYVDLTDTLDDARRVALDTTLPDLFAARACIEQAKGALMLVYGLSADQAFDLLQWRSQQTNTKLRALATQIVAEFPTVQPRHDDVRRQFDHLLLTVQQRVG